MQFGLFGAAQAQRGGPDVDSAAGFKDYIEYVIEAEALGYQSAFIVEHHFTGFGQVSATLNLLTWIGARTRRCASDRGDRAAWHNPLLRRKQAATGGTCRPAGVSISASARATATTIGRLRIPMEKAERRFEGVDRHHHPGVEVQ